MSHARLTARRFHFWATVLWATVGLALSWFLRNSLVWIVFMSLWANVVGHWSSYQASRAEEASNGDSS